MIKFVGMRAITPDRALCECNFNVTDSLKVFRKENRPFQKTNSYTMYP